MSNWIDEHTLDWDFGNGKSFGLLLYRDGSLEISVDDGTSTYERPNAGVSDIVVQAADAPDVLVAIQSWIENVRRDDGN